MSSNSLAMLFDYNYLRVSQRESYQYTGFKEFVI